MERDEFFEKAWSRFPAAKPGWRDVSSEISKGDVACGRLLSGALVFGGVRREIGFASKLQWLEPQRTDVEPSAELLRDGDLVAVRVSDVVAGRLLCDAFLLLVPCREPSKFNASFDVVRSREWMTFVASVREFFTTREFVEAATPTLVPSPGTEPFLDPFVTTWEIGSRKITWFLPTSPEFHLKKMLAAGWPKIFEVKNCFRNGEIGHHHQPEFAMLEWYRAFANLDAIADDVQALIEAVAKSFELPTPKVERTTMRDLFAQVFGGFSLKPESDVDDLRRLATKAGVGFSDGDDFDDLFHRLFLEKVEPVLAKKDVVILHGYPPSQAALSRLTQDGFADRFEVYWRGVELANAFHELNDPTSNAARFQDDATKKLALGKPPVPRDEALLSALRHGMPPAGGIALGMDRLFMSLRNLKTLEETRAFPITDD